MIVTVSGVQFSATTNRCHTPAATAGPDALLKRLPGGLPQAPTLLCHGEAFTPDDTQCSSWPIKLSTATTSFTGTEKQWDAKLTDFGLHATVEALDTSSVTQSV